MSRICKICSLEPEQRTDVERRIASRQPLAAIAALYSVSSDSVSRHRANHLKANAPAVQAVRQQERVHSFDVAHDLNTAETITLSILGKSYQSGDYDLALRAAGHIRKNCELQAKLTGTLQEPGINVLLSPQFQNTVQVLLAEIDDQSQRQRIATRLMERT